VVDTTGCGDSFTAGLIVGLSKGWDLRKTAGFANSVAAQVALGLGSDGNGNLKSLEDTLEFMESVPLLQ
jgi:sugar/nucleoside kinase (ribokinase family)